MYEYLISFQYFVNLQECCFEKHRTRFFNKINVYLQGKLREGLLSQNVNIYVVLFLIAKFPSIRVIQFAFSLVMCVCLFPHSLDNMYCFTFSIFASLIGEKWYLIVVLIYSLIIMNVV